MLGRLMVGGWWGTKRGGASVGRDRQGAMVGHVGHNSQGHHDAMGPGQDMWDVMGKA